MRDIELTKSQKKELSLKGLRKEVIEQRRKTRLAHEDARRAIVINKAKAEINKVTTRELLYLGAALYWAEGGKTGGVVRFSNSDPKMIQFMMKFFRRVCKIQEEKFRAQIHIHHHLNHKKAERYWSSVSQIPLKHLYKTYRKPNKGSQNKKDSLPYGTFDIYICSTQLLLTIRGWVQGLSEKLD